MLVQKLSKVLGEPGEKPLPLFSLSSSFCDVNSTGNCRVYPSHLQHSDQIPSPDAAYSAPCRHATVYFVFVPHSCSLRTWLLSRLAWRNKNSSGRVDTLPQITDVPETPWCLTANLTWKSMCTRSPLFFHLLHDFPSFLLCLSLFLLWRPWKQLYIWTRVTH